MMTQLSDKEHNVQMEDMKSFDEQMPCVGIFWYDMTDKAFFGVCKQELTPKMVEEATEKGTDSKSSLPLCYIIYPYVFGGMSIRGKVESSQRQGRIQ